MRTLQITRRVDSDGILRLEIPTEEVGEEMDVVVIIEPRQNAVHSVWREALRKTWGSCPDLEEPVDLLPEILEECR